MMQHSKFLTNSGPRTGKTHKSPYQGEILAPRSILSPELFWTFFAIINQNVAIDVAWRKTIVTPPPSLSETEHQKMAFLQKLVEVVRKSSSTKLSISQAEGGQDTERSAKIAPNSSQ